jgi:hypothetical protein
MALKIRRGINDERIAGGGVVFAEGELIYVTDTDALYIGDGVTPGGILLANSELGELSAYITANSSAGDDGELELNKPLNLNNQDIIGTGNINISGNITATGNIDIGDNTGDTVTIAAQVDSNITPTQDSTYSLGSQSKRWQNVYAAGLSVDGQIDAVSISANTVADNSTVMVNVATNTFTGNLTGDVSGNLTGNVQGNVEGNLVGDSDGYHTGDVKGSVFGDDSTPLVDAVAGVLRGDHYGNLYGSVKALSNGFTVLNPGTDGTDASFVGDVQGNLTGNVSGNVSGDVQGNVVGNTTGYHTGDVKGSVFGDDSVILVDAVAGIIPGSVISGTVTANLVGDVSGNVTGNVSGNIFTNLIDSEDSSAIIVTPILQVRADLIAEQSVIIGGGNTAGPGTGSVIINNTGEIFTDKLIVRNISTGTDLGVELEVDSSVTFSQSAFFVDELLAGGTLRATNFGTSNDAILTVETYTGPDDSDESINDPLNYTTHATVTPSKAEFGVPVRFPNFTTVERDALTAEAGMVIFNTTDTKLQVCTVGGGTPTWVDLH